METTIFYFFKKYSYEMKNILINNIQTPLELHFKFLSNLEIHWDT